MLTYLVQRLCNCAMRVMKPCDSLDVFIFNCIKWQNHGSQELFYDLATCQTFRNDFFSILKSKWHLIESFDKSNNT